MNCTAPYHGHTELASLPLRSLYPPCWQPFVDEAFLQSWLSHQSNSRWPGTWRIYLSVAGFFVLLAIKPARMEVSKLYFSAIHPYESQKELCDIYDPLSKKQTSSQTEKRMKMAVSHVFPASPSNNASIYIYLTRYQHLLSYFFQGLILELTSRRQFSPRLLNLNVNWNFFVLFFVYIRNSPPLSNSRPKKKTRIRFEETNPIKKIALIYCFTLIA